MDTTTLRGPWGDVSFSPLGGRVTSWRPDRHEVLRQSRNDSPDQDFPFGGIPVCAPWFGSGPGNWAVPHLHGVTARARWQVMKARADEHGAHVVMTLAGSATRDIPGADRFPSDLRYVLDVVADDARLTLGFSIASPSRDAVVEMAFHPFLATNSATALLTGLAGVSYLDFADGTTGSGDPTRLDGGLDRVYAESRPVTVTTPEGSLRLSPQGASTVVVWKPGPSLSPEADDFVCVEHGCVKSGAVMIPAGGAHLVRLTIAREGA